MMMGVSSNILVSTLEIGFIGKLGPQRPKLGDRRGLPRHASENITRAKPFNEMLYTVLGFLHQAQKDSRTDQHSATDLIENIPNMRRTRLFNCTTNSRI